MCARETLLDVDSNRSIAAKGIPAWVRQVVQDDAEETTVDGKPAVVIDEAQVRVELSELARADLKMPQVSLANPMDSTCLPMGKMI